MRTVRQGSLFGGIFLFFATALAAPQRLPPDIQARLDSLEQRMTRLESSNHTAGLLDSLRSSVVRVRAGLKEGSGFFVAHDRNLIVMNDHVVTRGQAIDVTVDDSIRVLAALVFSDPDHDLALLEIHPSICTSCTKLHLISSEPTALLTAGDQTFALGFPLHRALTITAGQITSVEPGAVFSSTNTNPGNSGGPLVNRDGAVIGISTFLDVSSVGPGISGAVAVDRLRHLLEQVPPSPDLNEARLPNLPSDRYPVEAIRALLDTLGDRAPYKAYNLDAEHLRGQIVTPVSHWVMAEAVEEAVAKRRRQREERAGLPASRRYTEWGEYRNWMEHVGAINTPVVVLRVMPKLGETSGSFWLNVLSLGLLGSPAGWKYEWKADVDLVHVLRNGEIVTPLAGGEAPLRVNQDYGIVAMRDVAFWGYYLFDPTLFEPQQDGKPPQIKIQVNDLKNPTDPL